MTQVISNGVNLLSEIAGIIIVIILIYAGYQFITSRGDNAGTGRARTSFIYAIVGLAVVALAQFLVHFVLSNFKA